MSYLYSLYDSKAAVYLPPFVARNDELARRMIAASLMNAKDIPPAEYPADYTLFKVAEWNDDIALTPCTHENVGNVLAILSEFRTRMKAAKVHLDGLDSTPEKPSNEYDESHV